jgi:hypothetical protein
MQYVREIFKGVTIYLAIHSYSVLILFANIMYSKHNISTEYECIAKYMVTPLKISLTYCMKFVNLYSIKLISSFAYLLSSPDQRQYELLPSLGVRRPSPSVVRRKLPHLNLLLWKPWTKLNQTWQGGSLSKLCPTALPFIQDGCCY